MKSKMTLSRRQYLMVVLVSVLAGTGLQGCKTKAEPSQTAPVTELAAPSADASGAVQNAPGADPKAPDAVNAQNPSESGKIVPPAALSNDWTLLYGEWLCLNMKGCRFADETKTKALFNMGYLNDHVTCNGVVVPDGLVWADFVCTPENGLTCSEHVERCQCGDKTIEGGETCVIENAKVTHVDDPCNAVNVPKGVECRKDSAQKYYCGGEALPSEGFDHWRCIDNKWMCMTENCACGAGKTGKFGHCINDKPMCGDAELSALSDTGYVCQNGQWVCANPAGCKCQKASCSQYQTCSDKGKCGGKSTKTAGKVAVCESSPCPCGDGFCPTGSVCVDKKCICGSLVEAYDWKDEGGDYGSFAMNPEFGEFSCTSSSSRGTSGGSTFYYLYCDREEGCHSTEATPRFMKKSDFGQKEDWIDGTVKIDAGDEDVILNSYEYVEKGVIYTKESDFVLKDSDRYMAKWADIRLQDCGRSSAESFGYEYGHHNSLDDLCEIRKACDTMPVPRANRGSYKCDETYKTYHLYSSLTTEEYNYIGLRCHGADCVCHHEVCADNAICTNGVCQFDTIYAHEVCGNVFPKHIYGAPSAEYEIINSCVMRTVDEKSLEDVLNRKDEDDLDEESCHCDNKSCYCIKGEDNVGFCRFVHISFSDAFVDVYHNDERGKLVTENGTCICGHSVYTPEVKDEYACIQGAGYQCLKDGGCQCGDTRCGTKQFCIRSGVCMDFNM